MHVPNEKVIDSPLYIGYSISNWIFIFFLNYRFARHFIPPFSGTFSDTEFSTTPSPIFLKWVAISVSFLYCPCPISCVKEFLKFKKKFFSSTAPRFFLFRRISIRTAYSVIISLASLVWNKKCYLIEWRRRFRVRKGRDFSDSFFFKWHHLQFLSSFVYFEILFCCWFFEMQTSVNGLIRSYCLNYFWKVFPSWRCMPQ